MKRDLYQEVTDQVIDALEKGCLPWRCTWDRSGAVALPTNYATKDAYHGINTLLLMSQTFSNGYCKNEWMTYKQAQAMGAQVRKGEKGTRCIRYIPKEVEQEGSDDLQIIPMIKAFTVFNVEQIDGLDLPEQLEENKDVFNPIERAENMIKATGADITEGGSEAFYVPTTDKIRLPDRHRFTRPEDFYATAIHEIGHWTGHPSREDRDMSGSRNTKSYAKEELVAEFFSAFACSDLQLKGDQQHVEYISSWLENLNKDKRFIFRAATKASNAYRRVVGMVEDAANL